jgi:hypothetical protein
VVAVADRLVQRIELGRAVPDRRVSGIDEAGEKLIVHVSYLGIA